MFKFMKRPKEAPKIGSSEFTKLVNDSLILRMTTYGLKPEEFKLDCYDDVPNESSVFRIVADIEGHQLCLRLSLSYADSMLISEPITPESVAEKIMDKFRGALIEKEYDPSNLINRVIDKVNSYLVTSGSTARLINADTKIGQFGSCTNTFNFVIPELDADKTYAVTSELSLVRLDQGEYWIVADAIDQECQKLLESFRQKAVLKEQRFEAGYGSW
ncbi:hypothetical protein [Chitinibacter tainanensis]|uniref:hypothetical protein n=1 Tax=Chitinibacter tainanensis TaxID=230667 RepID=UPI00048C955A|nr:hypothetical protein [Chitinibacter tainanensis]